MHTAYRLADLVPEQTQVFISRWYEAIQAAGWPVSEPAKKMDELQLAVKRADLAPLARNPLLLTLMATLQSNRARLPGDRADLYDEVVDLLLQRWNERVGADRGLLDALNIPTLTLNHLRKAIQKLAFEVHAAHVGEEGVADIPEGTLLKGLRPLLAYDTGKAALALEYVEKRAGLLLGQGERGGQRQYTFPHRTFQEYLAACHLAGLNDFYAKASAIACENPAHWREVLTLAARRAEADRGVPVADALVHRLSFKDWSASHSPVDLDWRVAVLAAEQLLEIGLAAVESDENHKVVRDRVAGWLGALLDHGALPVKERAKAGMVLGKLGDLRKGVGLGAKGLPDIDWIEIPAGRFRMGGQEPWEGGRQFECNLIRQPYQISRYAVTVAQYQAFVQAKGYETERYWTKAGWAWRKKEQTVGPESSGEAFQTPNHPQVGVSWYEAAAFCSWLSEQRKLDVRLPSEAEWERAARGTDARTYPWGQKTDVAQRCNMWETGIGHTSAVGMFSTGDAPCRAADMAGNVWEWCRTGWVGSYDGYEEKVIDDLEAEVARVLRGGAWINGPGDVRCAGRFNVTPGSRDYSIGFRCVVVGASAR